MGQQCSFGGGAVYSPPDSPTFRRPTKEALSYSREQAALRELFAAIRTGLVASETEFGVLPPGIATSGNVRLGVGSSIAKAEREAAGTGEGRAAGAEKEGDGLCMSLRGPGWAQGLVMRLSVRPVVGPFTGHELRLHWNENVLQASGRGASQLSSRTIPATFEDEVEFCKCCLLLAYHADPSTSFQMQTGGEDEEEDVEKEGAEKAEKLTSTEGRVMPLKMAAYHTLIANLDAIPVGYDIPSRFKELLYGSQGPVDVAIRPWPSNLPASSFGTAPRMRVKSGILFAEFLWLLRARFHLFPGHSVKLYHNHMPVHFSDSVSEKYHTIDCFVTERSGCDSVYGSYSSGLDVSAESEAALVVSLIGHSTQTVSVSLQMPLSEFDQLLRDKFPLKRNSFLLITSEDDYTPQYTCYDNWKCVYSFALPDSSFSAGLRRSFRRLSLRRQRRTDMQGQLPQEKLNEALMPHIEKVIQFLSSSARHFPSNLGKCDFAIKELLELMPMYRLPLDQCGIHQHAITQVFEVTGPSIPIVFKTISATSHEPSGAPTISAPPTLAPRTRLTNILDINPAWPLCTFLRYVEALVSPGASAGAGGGRRRHRLAMGSRSLENWEEEAGLTLGELLERWAPVWWSGQLGEGEERKPLTVRDIDPNQFLVIEKY